MRIWATKIQALGEHIRVVMVDGEEFNIGNQSFKSQEAFDLKNLDAISLRLAAASWHAGLTEVPAFAMLNFDRFYVEIIRALSCTDIQPRHAHRCGIRLVGKAKRYPVNIATQQGQDWDWPDFLGNMAELHRYCRLAVLWHAQQEADGIKEARMVVLAAPMDKPRGLILVASNGPFVANRAAAERAR